MEFQKNPVISEILKKMEEIVNLFQNAETEMSRGEGRERELRV